MNFFKSTLFVIPFAVIGITGCSADVNERTPTVTFVSDDSHKAVAIEVERAPDALSISSAKVWERARVREAADWLARLPGYEQVPSDEIRDLNYKPVRCHLTFHQSGDLDGTCSNDKHDSYMIAGSFYDQATFNQLENTLTELDKETSGNAS